MGRKQWVRLFAQLSGLARDVVSVAIDFSIMLFALFFFYKDGRNLFGRLYHILPLEERHKRKVFTRLARWRWSSKGFLRLRSCRAS